MLRFDRLWPRSRRLGRYRLSWLDYDTDHDVEACSGAFMLMPRDILAEAGGWDERYWFYGEDLDLCVRVVRLGLRVHYLGTTTATHVKGASSHLRERDDLLGPNERRLKRQVQVAIPSRTDSSSSSTSRLRRRCWSGWRHRCCSQCNASGSS